MTYNDVITDLNDERFKQYPQYGFLVYMLFPKLKERKDEIRQEKLRGKTLLMKVFEHILKDGFNLHVTLEYFYDLTDEPSRPELDKIISKSSTDGLAAGKQLYHIYDMQRVGTKEPGLNKARHLTARDGELKPSRRRKDTYLTEVWGVYMPVAHLWASVAYWCVNGLLLTDIMAGGESYNRFLEVAKLYQNVGSMPAMKRAKQPPIQDPHKIIKVPANIRPAELKPLSSDRIEWINKTLKSFKSPYKN